MKGRDIIGQEQKCVKDKENINKEFPMKEIMMNINSQHDTRK